MTTIQNVLIIGIGAIGRIYAAKLSDEHTGSLKILVDKSRLKNYLEKGVFFNNKEYHFDYILNENTNYKADLILIATKTYNLDESIKMIRNFVGPNTIIMSLLNGISSEKELIKNYGADKVLYSYFVGHASIKKGTNVYHDGIGKIVFGGITDKIKLVETFFNRVNINYEIPKNIESSMWQKFIMNVGINQTCAYFNIDYEGLQTIQKARDFADNLMIEAVTIARKLGIKETESFIENTFKLIDTMPPNLKPSMLQDIENKRNTEVDSFAGIISELGIKLQVKTPHNDLVLNKLKQLSLKQELHTLTTCYK